MNAPASPALTLKLFGRFELRARANGSGAGEVVPVSSRKARALLAYLSLAPSGGVSRDHLAALLWPDSGESHAKQSLRQALTSLRRALPDRSPVSVNGDDLEVDRAVMRDDVGEFLALRESPALEARQRAVALCRGELLEGLDARASTFDDWLMAERSRLRQLVLEAMSGLLELYRDRGETERAVHLGVRLVAMDGLRESAHRELMRLYATQGLHAAALKQYRTCKTLLRRELDVAPEPETESLYSALVRKRERPDQRDDETEAPETASAPPPGERHARHELRQCSVLAAALVPPAASQIDPEALRDTTARFARLVDECAARFGGVTVPAAGRTSLVVFGLPRARTSDSARALAAADALHACAESHGSLAGAGVRAALASGPVLYDALAGSSAIDVSADVFSLALDLNAMAGEGETLASEGVRNTLAARMEREPVPGAPAGYSFAVWRASAVRRSEPTEPQAELVGRVTEQRLFGAAADACLEEGYGQALLLAGEAGIGKSRLLERCVEIAGARGFECHSTQVQDYGAPTGAGPLARLVRSLLGLAAAPDASDAELVAERAGAGQDMNPQQRIYLETLLGFGPASAPDGRDEVLDPSAWRKVRATLLEMLVTRAARAAPLLLAIEDAHWAQPDLIEVIAGLADIARRDRVLLALTARSEGSIGSLREATGAAPLLTLDLSPLSDTHARALAAEIHGERKAGPHPRGFVDRCIERAGGNPLFLTQLLRAGERGWADVPDSIQSLVWARLDELEPAERLVAQAASVLGQRFRLDDLEALAGNALESCAALVAQRLLRRDGDGYAFNHALLSDGVYGSMPNSQRRELHAGAARHYAGRDAVLHAEHLERTADPDAGDAYVEAVKFLAREHRYERALALIDRLLARCADGDPGAAGTATVDLDSGAVFELVRMRGELLRDLGEVQASFDAFVRAAGHAREPEQTCRALIGQAAALLIRNRQAQALELLDEAQATASGLALGYELAQIAYYRGTAEFSLGRAEQCLASHTIALERSRDVGSARYEARALSGLADAQYLRGRIRSAGQLFDECVDVAREHGFARTVTVNLTMAALSRYYSTGAAALSLGTLDESLDGATRIGDLRGQSLALSCVSILREYAGRFEEAARAGEGALESARHLGAVGFQAESLAGLARARAELGDRESALPLAREAERLSAQSADAYVGPWVAGTLALLADDRAARRDFLSRGVALLAKGSVSHNHLHFYELAIRSALADADWDAARDYADALSAYTTAEPLFFADFVAERGRVLAAFGAGERGPGLAARARALLERENAGEIELLLPPLAEAAEALTARP